MEALIHLIGAFVFLTINRSGKSQFFFGPLRTLAFVNILILVTLLLFFPGMVWISYILQAIFLLPLIQSVGGLGISQQHENIALVWLGSWLFSLGVSASDSFMSLILLLSLPLMLAALCRCWTASRVNYLQD